MNASTTATKTLPAIVVAGDVCIDWLSVPVSAVPSSRDNMNWQLRNGQHMFAVPGGAWLTAEFIKATIDPSAVSLLKPGLPTEPLEKIPPSETIHSMIWLAPANPQVPVGPGKKPDNKEEDESKLRWMVRSFEGFAGPPEGKEPSPAPVEDDTAVDVRIAVLDDAGNGFRRRDTPWPQAIKKATPWILYKVRSPLADGPLWEHLTKSHLDRTIALISGDDLRSEGANISKRLSWERTATDVVRTMLRADPPFSELRRCKYCIVTLGVEGALLIKFDNSNPKSRKDQARLWYTPQLIEQELVGGRMSGFGSVFAAALAASLVQTVDPNSKTDPDQPLRDAISRALKSMQTLLRLGFGKSKDAAGKLLEPKYPTDAITQAGKEEKDQKALGIKLPKLTHLELPVLDSSGGFVRELRYRAWRMIETHRTTDPKNAPPYIELATRVVYEGLDTVFDHIPICKFGDLTMIDRGEIESYRAVRNLIHEFVALEKPERPLSLGVFGPPGSGKSFGVTQVALNVAGKGLIEKLVFNLSQWNDPKLLCAALHQVRDQALRGKVPLVFFDEFDAPLNGKAFGWLKYFLAPMQDGAFTDEHFTHQIGKAIFVFAGGTARTYREFESRAESREAEVRDAKLPDFLSRLRGYVDIFGFSPPCDTNLFRRANILRSKLLRTCPSLEGADKRLRIHPAVVRAFLLTPDYRHGARSMEAIVDMSRLVGCTCFDPSHLPPKPQLDLHLDGRAFLCLLGPELLTTDKIEEIAKLVNQHYEQSKLRWPSDALPTPQQMWDNLEEFYRNSNREHASFYPTFLAAAGCCLATAGDANFKFTSEQVEDLARVEHERWLEERRIKEPYHCDLVAWAKLPEEEREKDRNSIRGMPAALATQGLYIKRAQ